VHRQGYGPKTQNKKQNIKTSARADSGHLEA
jgi:hypothetical protein